MTDVSDSDDEFVIEGTSATPLWGIGTVFWADGNEIDLPPAPDPDEVDTDIELERFNRAVETADEELVEAKGRAAQKVGEDEAEVFEVHRQFLSDPNVTGMVETAINDGLPAAHAVQAAFDEHVATFEAMDGMMGERADDLRDVRDRLLRILTGGEQTGLEALPEGAIVLAERLTPSDTAQLDPGCVAGFATVAGGRTSHTAIMARSLGVPAVVGAGEALREIDDGQTVVIAADEDQLIVNASKQHRERATRGRDVEVVHDPVTTTDGREIEVAANVGTAAEVADIVEQGPDGIGLFRTEFFFVERDQPPTEDEQYEAFVDALGAFEECPDTSRVVVRTLDVGGDKPVSYIDLDSGENPFLGPRGIRLSLSNERDLFETQLRALLRAAATEGGGKLSIMFPLVATVEELDTAINRVETVAADLEAAGVDHAIPELGVMVETPASVLLAGEFARRVDFLSIGTNDLTQYVMAASREDERVRHLHDPYQPAVLRSIDRTVDRAHAEDAWVGMCGEMAGDPDLTELLIGLGLDELSMSAVTIPDVKARVTDISTDEARELADHALAAETISEVRDRLGVE